MPQSADQPIRIRFEHTRYPHWGGRSGYVQFVQHLDPRRFRSITHAAADSDEELPLWLEPVRPLLRRVVRRGRMRWYKLSDLNAELAAFADSRQRRHDIVHFLDGEHSGRFLPRLAHFSGLSGLRIIATFHQPPRVLQEILEPRLLQRFDQIVLVSPSQLPFFRQHVAEDRLHVILHGVDTTFFQPAPARRRSGALRCITAGHWLRDWKTFRAVALRMPSVMFDVVTSRDVDVADLPNVRRLENVDDKALAELYRCADLLFLPLIDSTANNSLLEGIASGLPLVASESVRAYAPGPEGLLIAGDRPEDFVEAIERLGEDDDLRIAMGAAARARAEALSWPNLAPHYEALYEMAMRRPQIRCGKMGAASANSGGVIDRGWPDVGRTR